MAPDLSRVIVVGNSGSGKTTFARALAGSLRQPYVEMDALYWMADWQVRPPEDFITLVEVATCEDRWIVDGNYGSVRNLTSYWSRATTVVWLNYGIFTSLNRALRRSIRRAISKEVIFSGNKESLSMQFFSRQSILWWILTTHGRRRRKFFDLRDSQKYSQLEWLEFRKPSQADIFLARQLPARGTGP